MDISLIGSSFGLLFLAELGDKTQLATMALANRYRALPVALGVMLAFLALNLLAVLVGATLFEYVPRAAVLAAAAALFLVFGWKSWRDAEEAEEDEIGPIGMRGVLVSSFLLIFLAELGDKTQLAMVALAAGSGDLWSVFFGGTAALWAVSIIGIALGATVLRRVPKRWMSRTAAVLFGVFGLVALYQAGVELGWLA